MEFVDEKFKISRILDAEKDGKIIQKASDNVSSESKRMTFNREKKIGTSLTSQWERICGSIAWVY